MSRSHRNWPAAALLAVGRWEPTVDRSNGDIDVMADASISPATAREKLPVVPGSLDGALRLLVQAN